MKKRIVGLLAIVMTLVLGSVVSAAGAKKDVTDIEVQAKYRQSGEVHPSVLLKEGAGVIKIGADTAVSVTGAPEDAVKLVVHKIPESEAEAWNWFVQCLKDDGKVIQPYDIYFRDADGRRMNVKEVSFTIDMNQKTENLALYSLTTGGKSHQLELFSQEDQYSFTADGSNYYIFAEEIPATPFVDVEKGAYYYDAVLWADRENITNGIDQEHFAPNEEATRGQVVTFLWRANGCPKANITKTNFRDVRAGDFYYEAILWAVENRITLGVDAMHFAPNEVVTRAEFATFLYRAEGAPGHTGKNPFLDIYENMYYYDAVIWAAENGITIGADQGFFRPNEEATRGQVVTFLYRMK